MHPGYKYQVYLRGLLISGHLSVLLVIMQKFNFGTKISYEDTVTSILASLVTEGVYRSDMGQLKPAASIRATPANRRMD